MAVHEQHHLSRTKERGIWLGFCGILLLTCVLAFTWSHVKLFWVDELLEFYSDTRPSFSAVLQGQLRYPFSLEPPAFHLLLHFMHLILPNHPELASRLPSLAGILITEICVFQVSRKLLHNNRAALFAMTLPFLFATFDFAAEARVYSVLTALFALSLAAYQSAVESHRGNRVVALCLLFFACSAAVLVHYYGLFFPLPLLAAEATRTLRNRRLDLPVGLVLLGSMCVFALNLPFLPALAEIRAHYYGGFEAEAGWLTIPVTYLWLVSQYSIFENNTFGYTLRFAAYLTIYVALPISFVTVALRQTKRETALNAAMFTALIAGMCLPLVNIFVAHYRTHAYVLRYSVPAVVPLAILFASFLAPYFRSRNVFGIVMLGSVGLAVIQAKHDIIHDWGLRTMGLAAEETSADLVRAQASTADQHVYIQDVAKFLTTYTYASPANKALLVGVQSIDRELVWLHRDPASIFLRNMHCSTMLPAISMEALRQQEGPHLFVVFDDSKEEWIGMELKDSKRVLRVEPMGHAFGGKLLRVSFSNTPVEDESSWTCKAGTPR